MQYADTKSRTLNLPIFHFFKQTLKEAADHEQRSMVKMLRVLFGGCCDRKGIVIIPQKVPVAPVHKLTRAERRSPAGVVA